MRGWTYWLGEPRHLARRLTVATVLGVFMGAIGPFSSYDLPVPVRLVAWTTSFWVGVLCMGAVLRLAETAQARIDLPRWFVRGAAVLVASAPLAAMVAGLFALLSPRPLRMSPLEWYLETLAIAAPLVLGYVALSELLMARPATATPAPSPASAAAGAAPAAGRADFLDRLPPKLGRDLIALQMEDHYVRAHTPRGSELVLIPLRQAIEELAGVDGLRTHRSWWVARAAVEGAREDGRNLRLVLRGGLEAPVARATVAELRAAGWLEG